MDSLEIKATKNPGAVTEVERRTKTNSQLGEMECPLGGQT